VHWPTTIRRSVSNRPTRRRYTAAIRLNPQSASAYNNRGTARRSLGDLDGAIADFSRALELNPRHANAYNNRGLVRQARGDLIGAATDFEAALRLTPPNGPMRPAYERNLAAVRQPGEAVAP